MPLSQKSFYFQIALLFVEPSTTLAQTYFSELFCENKAMGSCEGLKGKTIKELAGKLASDPFQANVVLIPDGRSLQKKSTDYKNPRIVMAPPVASPWGGKIFIGYSKNKNELEIISENIKTGKNEFFLVSGFPSNPKLEPQQGDTCLRCHPNGQAIFSAGPWSETNSNPRVAARLCEAQGGSAFYEGIPFTADCEKVKQEALKNPLAASTPSTARAFTAAFGIGAAVRRNSSSQFNRAICSQICKSSAEGSDPSQCRLNILKLAVMGGGLGGNLPSYPQEPKDLLTKYYKTELDLTFPFLVGKSSSDQELAKIFRETLAEMSLTSSSSLLSSEKVEAFSQGRRSSTLADREPRVPANEGPMSEGLKELVSKVKIFKDLSGSDHVTYDDFFSDQFADRMENIREGSKGTRRVPLPHLQELFGQVLPAKSDDKFEFQNPESDVVANRKTGLIPRELFLEYLAINARSCLGLNTPQSFRLDECLNLRKSSLLKQSALESLKKIAKKNWAGPPAMRDIASEMQDFMNIHCLPETKTETGKH